MIYWSAILICSVCYWTPGTVPNLATASIPCDGIIGMDFMEKYNCQVDLKPENDLLILRPDNLYNRNNNKIHFKTNQ